MTPNEIKTRMVEIICDYTGLEPDELSENAATAIMREFSVSPGWMPISTAPRDGQSILAAWDAPIPQYRAIGVVFHHNDHWLTSPGHFPKDIVAWQPAPSPPADLSVTTQPMEG